MKRILLVQTGFLGDVILSTAVPTELKKRYPESEIWFLTTPAARPLVEHHPALSGVIVFDKRVARRGVRGFFAMVSELRSHRFDLVFSLHKSWRTALLLFAAGIPLRYGFREAAGRLLYSKTAPRRDQPHDVLRNLAILRTIGIEPASCEGELLVALSSEAERESVEHLGLKNLNLPRLGIAPGSVWATKRWTAEGFIEVAKEFVARGAEVVIVGGESDAEIATEIARAVPEVRNLCGSLSLQGSAAVIRSCDLFLSNDSAPLHLASAFRVPTVAVFCATVPEFGFGPWRNRAESVGVDSLSCRPCGRHGANTCPTGTHACQRHLAATRVIAALQQVAHG